MMNIVDLFTMMSCQLMSATISAHAQSKGPLAVPGGGSRRPHQRGGRLFGQTCSVMQCRG